MALTGTSVHAHPQPRAPEPQVIQVLKMVVVVDDQCGDLDQIARILLLLLDGASDTGPEDAAPSPPHSSRAFSGRNSLPGGPFPASGKTWDRYAPTEVACAYGGGGGLDSAWRNRALGPHRNTARQAMDGLWTEVCGQQKQSNDPGIHQHILNTPIIGRR